MKTRQRALVICCHFPARDPRVMWHILATKRKYDVEVIYTEHPGSEIEHSEDMPNVKFHGHSTVKNPIIRSGFFRTMFSRGKNRLKSLSIQYPRIYILYVTLMSFWQQRASFQSLRNAADQLNRNFDLIIANDLDSLPAAVYIRKRYGGVLVYDAHEYWAGLYPSIPGFVKIGVTLYQRWYARSAEIVTTVSPLLVERLKTELHHDKVILLPNAAPLDANPLETVGFNSDERRQELTAQVHAVAQGRLVFLFQGRVAPERGLREIVGAWRYVPEDKAILIIRSPEGPNPELEDVISMASRDNTLGESVFFLPSVSERELILAASAADVGIIPYRPTFPNHVMACPNKLSQYMQAGLAVFSNDIPYVREIIEDAECGITYGDSDSFQDIADRIVKFAEEKDNLKTFKRNSIRYTKEAFNWDVFFPSIEDEIARIVGKRAKL